MRKVQDINSRFLFDYKIWLICLPYSQLLESKHKKLQSLEVRHQREKTEVEERLGQEEAAVTALREEMDTKDQLLGKLRVSTKEVSEIQKSDTVLGLFS